MSLLVLACEKPNILEPSVVTKSGLLGNTNMSEGWKKYSLIKSNSIFYYFVKRCPFLLN